MSTDASLLPQVYGAISKRIRFASKHVYQAARWRNLEQHKVLFIVGCQRSGTTIMLSLFDADMNCRVFGEFSALSSADRQAVIRLNPLLDVAALISRVHAPLVVAKPLVETQNVRTLLNHFPGSTALFMYRSYADVARSDLALFGIRNGIENIRPIAEGEPHNWRSAGASDAVRDVVRRFYAQDMNPYDAAALFWYARNHLYLDLELARRPDVILCKYEHFTREPATVLRRIYERVGVPCPDLSHIARVHSSSIEKGRSLEISAAVRDLCDELQRRLDEQHASEWGAPAAAATTA